jgi:fused signal recognition particle receptor
LLQRGRSVLLAATDTYREAAAEQLAIWARRLSVPCVTGQPGGDPAAVAFNAIDAAVARELDTVVVDTAGRLHTRSDLVEELKKVHRVVGRKRPGAPHETFLVVDATTGQNAVSQAITFTRAVSVTGMIVTKLDGTAKGGSVVAVRHQLGLPIRFLGVGESLEDLEPFVPERFAEQLIGE